MRCINLRALARRLVPALGAVLLASAGATQAAGTGALDRVSGWYAAGSNVTVTATAGSYSIFGSWSGHTNGCTIAGNQITIPVSGARSVMAIFALKKTTKGTAESWLNSFSQTNGTPDQAELVDSDGDGGAAWQEYIAGTDPTNSNDYFRVMIVISNGIPVASFRTIVATSDYYGSLSRHYAMEQVLNLASTNWTILPGYSNISANGSTIACTNSTSTNMIFYRVKAWLE
jgi:hypothetical protein